MKLTKAQQEVLEWIGSNANGVDGIRDRRTAEALLNKGLVEYLLFEDAWRITRAGRTVLEPHQ